ncbi:MAG: pilus assembly protein [Alphaproteobacteria bacterium]|nr:pilus assembly protein [Alphaproteobacteria bacterium]
MMGVDRRRFRSGLLRDQRGAVAMIIGLATIPLFAALGLAIDSARGYMLQSKLSYAVDAAGLAGGRAFDTELREDDILMFFEANFPPGYMDAELVGGAPVVTFDDEANTITIEAAATIPTRLMNIAGIPEFTVSARAVIQRQLPGMELTLVMDNTGSMRSGGKIDAMKDAATTLIDILYGDRETVDNFWVGLVPYSAMVNIGNSRISWMDGFNPEDFEPTSWKGCVEARSYPNDSNDALPQVEKWQPFLWPTTLEQYSNPHHVVGAGSYDENDPSTWGEFLNGDNDWDPDGLQSDLKEDNSDQNEGTGPNLGCGPAITPLIASKTDVLAAIDEMLPWHRGGTMANLGLAWGWRVLSPTWQGIWGGDTPSDLPKSYAEENSTKAVVLLTDGENQWYDWPGTTWTVDGETHYSGIPGSNKYPDSYDDDFNAAWPGADFTAYGRLSEGRLGTTNNSAAKSVINDRMLELCTAMKAEGIVIYTITFQLSDTATQQLYRNCASGNEFYFNSPSNSDLQQVFVQIADELSSLRIAE